VDVDHAVRLRAHYNYVVKNMEVKPLLTHLSTSDVISPVDMYDMSSERDPRRQVHLLISLVVLKPAEDFDRFIVALERTGQSHVKQVVLDDSTIGKYI